MKKSLIALAVLAASGAAMAQSSVTLYGVADIWLGGLKADQQAGNPDRVTSMGSGGLATSRWGMKGSEDLGGGLKAVFNFETAVAVDSGASTGFDRVSYVGVSGGFGEVLLGKPWTAIDDVMGASNSGFDSALSATKGVWVSNNIYAGNPGNTIKYSTPSFGGLKGAVAYSLDEAAGESTDIIDFAVSYAGGPATANLGYQVQKDTDEDLKIMTVNGTYDFGVAKLLASYAKTSSGDFDAKEYQIGVDVPLSSALTLSAGYASSKRSDAAAAAIATLNADTTETFSELGIYNGKKNTGYGIALGYSLSKRTTVYGGFSTAKGEDAAGADVSKRQLYAVGVNHKF
ncbi:porin [Rhodoferax sp. 4810]|nr:porin [Rhodoferax jenense]